jgi:hypothetical protein
MRITRRFGLWLVADRREEALRYILELDRDLGGPLWKTLPRAKVEGDTRPTPVINL